MTIISKTVVAVCAVGVSIVLVSKAMEYFSRSDLVTDDQNWAEYLAELEIRRKEGARYAQK